LPVVLGGTSRGLGAEEGEHGGHRGRVAELLEEAADAGERDGGEEVLKVEVDDDVASEVRTRVGDRGATLDETVGGLLEREPLQDLVKDPLLCRASACGAPRAGACLRALGDLK
jgi:hypothetical protein